MKTGGQMDYRKIDALVAEHIMGYEFYISGNDVRIKLDNTDTFVCFSPSTNISASWQVVEKMHEEDYSLIQLNFFPSSNQYNCAFQYLSRIKGVFAETAPLAICLASLKVKGIDTNE